jgi:hypothetical protein
MTLVKRCTYWLRSSIHNTAMPSETFAARYFTGSRHEPD